MLKYIFYISLALGAIDIMALFYFFYTASDTILLDNVDKMLYCALILAVLSIWWIVYLIIAKHYWYILLPGGYLMYLLYLIISLRNN